MFHIKVIIWNDHFGCCMEKGLWEGENGSREISEALAGDTGNLNQGSGGGGHNLIDI